MVLTKVLAAIYAASAGGLVIVAALTGVVSHRMFMTHDRVRGRDALAAFACWLVALSGDVFLVRLLFTVGPDDAVAVVPFLVFMAALSGVGFGGFKLLERAVE